MNYPYANRMNDFGRSPIREILKLATQPGVISLAAGSPNPASYPVEEIKEILNRMMDTEPVRMLQYGISEGFPPLQETLRHRMQTRYHSCSEADGILITSGAQQGIEAFAKTFLNEGDGVICEDPSFISALNAIRSYNGGRLIGIPVDQDGMRMDLLEEALQREKNVKFIYTIPTFQNPTGVTLSLERRKKMLELAKRYQVMILEDSPYFELRYSGEELPTIKSLDRDGIVTFVGSLSKILAPGIRVGFLIGPREIIRKVTKCKQISDVHTTTLMQAVCDVYLRDYDVDAHIRQICDRYRESRDVMLDALAGMDPRVRYTRPEGGLFLWVTLPEGCDAEKLIDATLAKGKVVMVSGGAFTVEPGGFSNCFRLNFSMPTHEQIRRGVAVIRECVDEMLNA